jgi:hypothetical protein
MFFVLTQPIGMDTIHNFDVAFRTAAIITASNPRCGV